MLSNILHHLVANPIIYDLVQKLAGAKQSEQHLREQCSSLPSPQLVLDLGGGTGRLRHLWPTICQYVCLDIELPKLRRFLDKYPDGNALLADATLILLANNCVDVVVCVAVAHHIADERFSLLLCESVRVLRENGYLIFLEPVWSPNHWVGRWLWKYDQGAYPRVPETLRRIISTNYQIRRWKQYAIYHEYVLCKAVPLDRSLC